MYTAKALAAGIQGHVVRWLVKGPGASWVIAATFALAGVSAAAINAPARADVSDTSTTTTSVMYPGCWADPDGDGHIFCDSSVSVSSLPAAYGACSSMFDESRIFCQGDGR